MSDDNGSQKVFLTGLPVSNEMKILLDQMKRKEYVSIDRIEATHEIMIARNHVAHSIATINIVGRDAERLNWLSNLKKMGSVSEFDTSGEPIYNGNIKRNSRLDIVIGLPASGKSSSLANIISQEYHSRVIDNDEAKKQIPEFNNGWGAGIVHEESQKISDLLLNMSLQQHENIVLPKVGSDIAKMLNIITYAKMKNYKVYLHYFELDRNIALGRMINRFIEQGRFLDPQLIDKYCNNKDGNKIEQTYKILKEEGNLDGYSKWNNDVKRGEKPILIETNCRGKFITKARVLPSYIGDSRRGRQERSFVVPGYGRKSGPMGKNVVGRNASQGRQDLQRSETELERNSILEKLHKNITLQNNKKEKDLHVIKSDKTL